MAQYWDLVNLDKRATLRCLLCSNIWEYIRKTPTEQLVGLLRKWHWIRFNIANHYIRVAKSKSGGAPLIRLPQEIIDGIVCFVSRDTGVEDVICLALTCTYFFRLLAGAVQDALRRDLGPWAGDRLVFKGDNGSLCSADAPECMITAMQDLEREITGKAPVLPSFDTALTTVAEGKYGRIGRQSYEKPVEVYGVLLRSLRKRLKGETPSLRRFKRLLRMLTQEPNSIKHGNKEPVLRNITTKEYVRDAALAKSDYAYSLGELVMVQTIWTDNPKDVARLGVKARWAGHRFDISVMADVATGEWRDVSEEAVSRMAVAATEQFKKAFGRRAYSYNPR